MNDVELLSGYRGKFGVNAVYKIPHECQSSPSEEEHDHTHDNTPDQHLAYHFQCFIRVAHVAHVLPPDG